MKKSLNYTTRSNKMYQNTDGLMKVRIQNVQFRKKISKEQTTVHNVRIITYVDIRKHKLISLLTNDMNSTPDDIIFFSYLPPTMGDITSFQANQAELPAEIVLRRKRQSYQDSNLGDIDFEFAVDGNAKRLERSWRSLDWRP